MLAEKTAQGNMYICIVEVIITNGSIGGRRHWLQMRKEKRTQGNASMFVNKIPLQKSLLEVPDNIHICIKCLLLLNNRDSEVLPNAPPYQ